MNSGQYALKNSALAHFLVRSGLNILYQGVVWNARAKNRVSAQLECVNVSTAFYYESSRIICADDGMLCFRYLKLSHQQFQWQRAAKYEYAYSTSN